MDLFVSTDTSNVFAVEERARGNVAVAGGFGDFRYYTAAWSSIPQRSISHTKRLADTIIKVTYYDTLGWITVGHGSGCNFRLLVDGVPAGREMWTHGSTGNGWRIHPSKLMWYV